MSAYCRCPHCKHLLQFWMSSGMFSMRIHVEAVEGWQDRRLSWRGEVPSRPESSSSEGEEVIEGEEQQPEEEMPQQQEPQAMGSAAAAAAGELNMASLSRGHSALAEWYHGQATSAPQGSASSSSSPAEHWYFKGKGKSSSSSVLMGLVGLDKGKGKGKEKGKDSVKKTNKK